MGRGLRYLYEVLAVQPVQCSVEHCTALLEALIVGQELSRKYVENHSDQVYILLNSSYLREALYIFVMLLGI